MFLSYKAHYLLKAYGIYVYCNDGKCFHWTELLKHSTVRSGTRDCNFSDLQRIQLLFSEFQDVFLLIFCWRQNTVVISYVAVMRDHIHWLTIKSMTVKEAFNVSSTQYKINLQLALTDDMAGVKISIKILKNII